MRSHAPFELIVTKFCGWGRVGDVITDAKFYGNRLRGFRVIGPPTQFPMLNVHRPYNSVCIIPCCTVLLLHVVTKVWFGSHGE